MRQLSRLSRIRDKTSAWVDANISLQKKRRIQRISEGENIGTGMERMRQTERERERDRE